MTSAPDVTRLRQIQAQLEELSDLVESDPRRVLDTMPALLDELQHWPRRDAYLWCLHLTAQAFRFTDDLDAAVRTAELALEAASVGSGFAAGFHLEAGMALNQRGAPFAADEHLRSAIAIYGQLNDVAGLAWALVALADSLCGLARQDEALALVTEGEAAARTSNDQRVLTRALKQRAVVQRLRGNIADALMSIEHVVMETTGHAHANALLERGHILTMTSAYAAAIDDYVTANTEYYAHGDRLGLANTERALATIDLLLGRDSSAMHHLDAAATLYRELGNHSGLGYALRERSVVLLARDPGGAERDAAEAVRAFEASGDLIGLTSAWRAVARVAAVNGDDEHATAALANAQRFAQDSNNLLAIAGIRLMQAEIGPPAHREQAATAALRLYDQLDIPIGSAHAAGFAARAAAPTSADAAEQHLNEAVLRLRRARDRVADPASRADHDLSLRTVPATIVEVAATLGTATARDLSADALLDSFPLGLRSIQAGSGLSAAVLRSARRAQRLQVAGDTAALRAALRRLAVDIATLPAPTADPAPGLRIADLRAAAPSAAVLLIGAPLPSGQVPVVTALPGRDVTLHLPALDAAGVDSVDALGRLAAGVSPDMLWRPGAREWQHSLADVFFPLDFRNHVSQEPPSEALLVVHPTLAHVPFEALYVDADRPFGVAAAVRRLPLLRPSAHQGRLEGVAAFFDPALRWPSEQAVVGVGVPSAATWLASLGPHRLGVFAAHGHAGAGFDGWLTTTDRSQVVTAADMLLKDLEGSVVVFEACWAGRHAGHRNGETLNVTTAALLAGAASIVAGLWALPADPECTGRITADCLTALNEKVSPAEALRRARERFLSEPAATVRVPGSAERMQQSAPWAWAGLCAFG
jgi:tetratricopeptide (TPR) repeat protein